MGTNLNPYLAFGGNAREAMEHYGRVFGGEPTFSTFGEFGGQDTPDADKIMHAQLVTDKGFTLMASDTTSGMELRSGNHMTVSLSGDDAEELRGYWEGLSEDGEVAMPLEKQMWGDEFGMVTDRFGIPWMVNISQPQDG
ncbi:MAG: VOC family protein [Marmoricola sp.]